MSELGEVLKKLTFAPDDDVTKSGKVMSGKDWKRDIIKAEKEVRQWALGLLPTENPNTDHDGVYKVNQAIAEIRKKIAESK